MMILPSLSRMFCLLIVPALTFSLSACGTVGAYQSAVAGTAQQAADQKYDAGLWSHCQATTTGVLLRMSEEDRSRFMAYCTAMSR